MTLAMRELGAAVEATLEEVFVTQDRLSRDEIYRRAIAADAPPDVISALDGLPEGEYAQDEVAEVVTRARSSQTPLDDLGVPGEGLTDEDLMRELAELHRTRNDTLRHGSDNALDNHTRRTAELEQEYLRRFPQREVDPERLRDGGQR
jgi:hypothetical protein